MQSKALFLKSHFNTKKIQNFTYHSTTNTTITSTKRKSDHLIEELTGVVKSHHTRSVLVLKFVHFFVFVLYIIKSIQYTLSLITSFG